MENLLEGIETFPFSMEQYETDDDFVAIYRCGQVVREVCKNEKNNPNYPVLSQSASYTKYSHLPNGQLSKHVESEHDLLLVRIKDYNTVNNRLSNSLIIASWNSVANLYIDEKKDMSVNNFPAALISDLNTEKSILIEKVSSYENQKNESLITRSVSKSELDALINECRVRIEEIDKLLNE